MHADPLFIFVVSKNLNPLIEPMKLSACSRLALCLLLGTLLRWIMFAITRGGSDKKKLTYFLGRNFQYQANSGKVEAQNAI
jgi:hypothetical protein